VPQAVVNALPALTTTDSTAIVSTAIGSRVAEEQLLAAEVNPTTALAAPASAVPLAAGAPDALPAISLAISAPEHVATARLPEQIAQQNKEPAQPPLRESFAWAVNANLYMRTRFENQSAHVFSGPSSITDRLEDSVYGDLTDSLTRAKKQSFVELTEGQSAHSLAVQSIMKEFQHDFTAAQENSELLVGAHFRNQVKLAKKAVDNFHLHLVASD
jgi:hypothetical protein